MHHPPSFYSHHSPFGFFASVPVGLVSSPGGFGQSLSRPRQARQNVCLGPDEVLDPQGRFATLLAPFRRHFLQFLRPGVRIDAGTGGESCGGRCYPRGVTAWPG